MGNAASDYAVMATWCLSTPPPSLCNNNSTAIFGITKDADVVSKNSCVVRGRTLPWTRPLDMSARKRKGHNWKARQVVKANRRSIPDLSSLIEDSSKVQDTQGDTNFVALPSKGASRKDKSADDHAGPDKKRPKLNQKQKKRLRKVLEAKEKKAKVCRQSIRVSRSVGYMIRMGNGEWCVSLSEPLKGMT